MKNTTSEKISVIICAAGKGSRAGFAKNKLLLPHPDGFGESVLLHTIKAFLRDDIDEIIIAVSPCDKAEIAGMVAPFSVCKVVLGGNTRAQSVRSALKDVTGEIVLIHDGARPYVTAKIIDDCIDSVKEYDSGICALPATDTTALGENGVLVATVQRDKVFSLQTPQAFFTKSILYAYEKAFTDGVEDKFTDDSAIYAEYVAPPRLVLGDRNNKKLTFASDFVPFASPVRVGVGIDTHAFGKAQDYIVMAGVKIPSDSGLIAHSDGDVLTHAVMDALLSAAGLFDIGHYFPDTDQKWKDADSLEMLDVVLEEVKKQGLAPLNLAVAVQAQKPRMAKYVAPMSENLAKILSLPLSAVGITVGTNEGLGYVGEGKGITVTANVLLRKL